MKKLEIGDISRSIPLADGREFDLDIFREVGYFVVRDVIPKDQMRDWQAEWDRFYEDKLKNRDVNPFNPVHVNEDLPPKLADIHKCPHLLDVVQQLHPNLGLFMQRFVIKDRHSQAPVFVHQDFCYDFGWPDRTSVFVPLSECNKDNGGISFYPGTHHFGYLGDAGELNTDILSDDWPVVYPSLNPGDIAMMHTFTWHASPPPVKGPDRILVQAAFVSSEDPSAKSLLRGQWTRKFDLTTIPREKFFVRCRSSRLRELQAEVDAHARATASQGTG
jgi:ectoine hydroxylase-related dioxygenase (phytanoyl-CoA dioxygenase family)